MTGEVRRVQSQDSEESWERDIGDEDDGEVRSVLNRAQLEDLYGTKLAVFQDRESGESPFLPG